MPAIRQNRCVPAGKNLPQAILFLAVVFVSACTDTPNGSATLNQPDGMVISAPEFLNARAIVQGNLDARVSVEIDGVDYPATRTSATASPWVGQVFVPVGSDPRLKITWVETDVAELPVSFQGELPLAVYDRNIGQAITVNQSVEIETGDYQTSTSDTNPLPQLDADSDGASNLEERQAGSRPGDARDIPPSVLILYTDRAPVIDGRYDSLWGQAQFLDQQRESLTIENVVLDDGVVQDGEDRNFKWAAMHDGEYLYVLVFAERGPQQSPHGDSPELFFQDDSVDIYWDGNNSKGASYDGFDDYHVITALLGSDGGENQSSQPATSRMQFGDRSAPIDPAAIRFGVCLCQGDQQIYEFRIDLNAGRIPTDTTFGFEININNDVDGGIRDAKWAWFNDTGVDDTWRFPLKMGNVRLEALPQ
ncbi:MAG: sugar-binding protein [Granulosicoccus sp.]